MLLRADRLRQEVPNAQIWSLMKWADLPDRIDSRQEERCDDCSQCKAQSSRGSESS